MLMLFSYFARLLVDMSSLLHTRVEHTNIRWMTRQANRWGLHRASIKLSRRFKFPAQRDRFRCSAAFPVMLWRVSQRSLWLVGSASNRTQSCRLDQWMIIDLRAVDWVWTEEQHIISELTPEMDRQTHLHPPHPPVSQISDSYCEKRERLEAFTFTQCVDSGSIQNKICFDPLIHEGLPRIINRHI